MVCRPCQGTGEYRSKDGKRVIGECYRCQGVGRVAITGPLSHRERRLREASNWADFAAAEPELAKYMIDASPDFPFAARMREAIERFGTMSPRQLEAMRNSHRIQRGKDADVAIATVSAALNTAHGRGLLRPILRLGQFRFARAPDSGKNPGHVYITTNDSEEVWLGKVAANGVFVRTPACTDQLMVEIQKVASTPAESALEYGRMTGACSACGRRLSDPESVSRAIGPTCYEKFFGP